MDSCCVRLKVEFLEKKNTAESSFLAKAHIDSAVFKVRMNLKSFAADNYSAVSKLYTSLVEEALFIASLSSSFLSFALKYERVFK